MIICENPRDPEGEIILETYTKDTTLEKAQERVKKLELQKKSKYSLGTAKIVKVEFTEINNNPKS